MAMSIQQDSQLVRQPKLYAYGSFGSLLWSHESMDQVRMTLIVLRSNIAITIDITDCSIRDYSSNINYITCSLHFAITTGKVFICMVIVGYDFLIGAHWFNPGSSKLTSVAYFQPWYTKVPVPAKHFSCHDQILSHQIGPQYIPMH